MYICMSCHVDLTIALVLFLCFQFIFLYFIMVVSASCIIDYHVMIGTHDVPVWPAQRAASRLSM